jgi:hypothetical protein
MSTPDLAPRSPARSRLLVFLVLALALAVAAPSASAKGMAPLETGVSDVFDNDLLAFENVKASGAKYAQTLVRWAWIAPKNPPAHWNPADPADPNYDWEAMDLWVTRAVATGLTPVLMVYGAPRWAQACPPGMIDEAAPCRPDPSALAAFARAAAARYSGSFPGLPRVHYWQGLNEPNLSLFFGPQYEGDRAVSPELYRTLINSFYFAVKSVHPTNLVLAAGLGPIAVPGFTIGPMAFTRQLLCMRDNRRPTKGDCGGGVHFDIFDIHPYTTGGPTHTGGKNDVQLGDLEKLVDLLGAADRANRIKGRFGRTPLWITEFAWDTNPPDPGGLEMSIAVRWTAEAMHQAWKSGINHFFWFSLRDFKRDPGEPASAETLETGLYFRGATLADDQPKETLHAFRFPFVSYPERGGLRFWGRTPNSRGGKVVIQIRKPGGWRKAAVVKADKAGMFRGLARGVRYGKNRKGWARAHYHGQSSPPFSMRPVPDFRQPPFG